MTNLTAAFSARFGHFGGKLALSSTGVAHRPRHGWPVWQGWPGVFAERQPRSPRWSPAPAALSCVQGRRKLLGRCGVANFPRHLRRHELDPTSRRRTGAPWQWSSFGRLAPAWAAFLCLRVEGDPSELPGHVDTARTARRPPLVVAHGSTFDAHETCCTARRLRWSASGPRRCPRRRCGVRVAQEGAGRAARQSPGTKIVQRHPGARGDVVCQKRVPQWRGRTLADLATNRKIPVAQSEQCGRAC